MPWFAYKRGGWEIAVDAVSHQDASKFMAKYEAEYIGEIIPPTTTWSHMTAMTTPKRQEIISAKIRKEQGF